MFGLFNKKKGVPGLVGVSLNDRQLALAHVTRAGGELALSACESREITSIQEAGKVLADMVGHYGLQQARCNYVLAPDDYSLLLVEAPPVEKTELAAAAKWKIKDMVDRPLDQLAVTVFPVPPDAYRSQREMLYVVAAEKKKVQQVVAMITAAGLQLDSIDIPEMAMRNLVSTCTDDTNGLAVIDLRHNGSLLNLSRGGSIYLTRHLSTQVADDVMGNHEWDAVKERLVLEIQRSLDYYESQMGQGHINRVLLAPRKTDSVALEGQLNEAMGVRVEMLDLDEKLGGEIELTPALQQSALMAIGGALRAGQAA